MEKLSEHKSHINKIVLVSRRYTTFYIFSSLVITSDVFFISTLNFFCFSPQKEIQMTKIIGKGDNLDFLLLLLYIDCFTEQGIRKKGEEQIFASLL